MLRRKYHSVSACMGLLNTQEQVKSISWNPQAFPPKQHHGQLFLRRPEVVRKRPFYWGWSPGPCACSASTTVSECLTTTPYLLHPSRKHSTPLAQKWDACFCCAALAAPKVTSLHHALCNRDVSAFMEFPEPVSWKVSPGLANSRLRFCLLDSYWVLS